MADGSKTCSVEGCGVAIHKRGVCRKHYHRLRNYGDAAYQPKWEHLAPRLAPAPVGQQFGRWTVLAEAPPRWTNNVRYWLCRCECGVEREVARALILRGESTSCGCSTRKSKTCTEPECGKPSHYRGLCWAHYRVWRASRGLICTVADCDRPAHGRSMCDLHLAWVRRYGEPRKPPKPPPKPSQHGYIVMYRNGVYRGEHVWLMEDILGRPLKRDAKNRPIETVHHINGVKHDNRTAGPLVDFRSGNLELWSNSHPSGQRVSDKVAWAVELLRLYAPERLI